MPDKNSIQPSTLYLVATPIGNLEDMTFRALKVLGAVDLIAAEDTRHSLKLLTHFGIKPQKLISCFDHNEVKRVSDILQTLESGGTVALITDAGMPAISDPGYLVVKAVAEKGFAVSPVPGASSLLAALAASGLAATPFTFLGFLPPKAGDRRSALLQARSEERTLVFFESPHRLRASLKDMLNVFGNRSCAVARELTKLHEEFARGGLQSMVERFKDQEPLGEFVIVVEGAEKMDRSASEKWQGASIEDQLAQFMREGLSKTEAVKAVCKLRGLPREVVYQIATGLKPADPGEPEGDSEGSDLL
ncbi:MAG TPA: 16S rRNA (cytidine(1402)-2'-O)-methyltransferase [bacterium]|nr:16S rRNA (cytidine(1402)-2'-O)-methyltransferase [bacterium]